MLLELPDGLGSKGTWMPARNSATQLTQWPPRDEVNNFPNRTELSAFSPSNVNLHLSLPLDCLDYRFLDQGTRDRHQHMVGVTNTCEQRGKSGNYKT